MYGGDNFRQSQFNLAVQGERQAGSSFKPFVLATALREGIAPSTTFASQPVSIFIGDRYWNVHNYEGGLPRLGRPRHGDDPVGQQHLRPADEARRAQAASRRRRGRLGITRRLNPYFAIGLGADPVSPLEMARAYSTFANQGYRVDGRVFGNRPRAIVRVGTAGAKVVENNAPMLRSVLPRNEDALLTSILEGVVREGPAGGRRFRTASPPARRARRRTTATRGSSATHRSSRPQCGSATRTSSCR